MKQGTDGKIVRYSNRRSGDMQLRYTAARHNNGRGRLIQQSEASRERKRETGKEGKK